MACGFSSPDREDLGRFEDTATKFVSKQQDKPVGTFAFCR